MAMYPSSENSDSEYESYGNTYLDFSHQLLDTESLSYHLKNSIKEQITVNKPRTSNEQEQKTNNQLGVKSKFPLTLADVEEDDLDDETQLVDEDQLDDITNKIYLQNNMIINIPSEILLFSKLRVLDLSNNNLTHLNDFILHIPTLRALYLKNNYLQDDSFPKELSSLTNLKELNISGNTLTRLPQQIYSLSNLKYLYAGNNRIEEIPKGIKTLQNLQILHVGGNHLEIVPDELGELTMLNVLGLCDNKLRRLPRAISQLKRLKTLLLHRNKLCCLPVEIVKLRGLTELSLRENPLVTKFVNSCARDIMFTAPTLKELAARSIRSNAISYGPMDLPYTLLNYLESGHRCVNPACKGMYFTSCVEHIKFVDFCGKYRVPLMHYLCSSRCSSGTPSFYSNSESDSDDDSPSRRMKKVLLG